MLYHLLAPLRDDVVGFRLFQFITFRAVFAALLAFLVSTVVGPAIVEWLRKKKISGFVAVGDASVDAARQMKSTVPTMGGVILLVGVGISGLLFARLDMPHTWLLLLSFLAFGTLGAIDDWRKLTRKGGGISEKQKLFGQLAIAAATLTTLYALGNMEDNRPWMRGPSMQENPYQHAWTKRHDIEVGESWSSLATKYLKDPKRAAELARHNGVPKAVIDDALLGFAMNQAGSQGVHSYIPEVGREIRIPPVWPQPNRHHRADLQIPLFKGFCLDLGLLFIPLGILVIVGASNAVNLTDGLDGLAIGVTISVCAALGVIAYLVGRLDFSRELYVFYVPEAGELAVIAAALFGGSLGFLWFNSYPATVFMGDTGSLAIGGFVGVLAVMLRQEFTLAIAGGVFVAEALSVIWQRTYFKGTRRAARKRGDPEAVGKRWFKCAPVHHHFEKVGWHENKVTVRFWIVSIICALAAVASLKVR